MRDLKEKKKKKKSGEMSILQFQGRRLLLYRREKKGALAALG